MNILRLNLRNSSVKYVIWGRPQKAVIENTCLITILRNRANCYLKINFTKMGNPVNLWCINVRSEWLSRWPKMDIGDMWWNSIRSSRTNCSLKIERNVESNFPHERNSLNTIRSSTQEPNLKRSTSCLKNSFVTYEINDLLEIKTSPTIRGIFILMILKCVRCVARFFGIKLMGVRISEIDIWKSIKIMAKSMMLSLKSLSRLKRIKKFYFSLSLVFFLNYIQDWPARRRQVKVEF